MTKMKMLTAGSFLLCILGNAEPSIVLAGEPTCSPQASDIQGTPIECTCYMRGGDNTHSPLPPVYISYVLPKDQLDACNTCAQKIMTSDAQWDCCELTNQEGIVIK